MPPKIRKLKAELRKEGFYSRLGKGSHLVFYHHADPSLRVTISGRARGSLLPPLRLPLPNADHALVR